MSNQFGDAVDFSCPHCGARYIVSYAKLPIADSGSDYCELLQTEDVPVEFSLATTL